MRSPLTIASVPSIPVMGSDRAGKVVAQIKPSTSTLVLKAVIIQKELGRRVRTNSTFQIYHTRKNAHRGGLNLRAAIASSLITDVRTLHATSLLITDYYQGEPTNVNALQ